MLSRSRTSCCPLIIRGTVLPPLSITSRLQSRPIGGYPSESHVPQFPQQKPPKTYFQKPPESTEEKWGDQSRKVKWTTYAATIWALCIGYKVCSDTWNPSNEPVFGSAYCPLRYSIGPPEVLAMSGLALTGYPGECLLQPPVILPATDQVTLDVKAILGRIVSANSLPNFWINNMCIFNTKSHPLGEAAYPAGRLLFRLGEIQRSSESIGTALIVAYRLSKELIGYHQRQIEMDVLLSQATWPALMYSAVAIASRPARRFALPALLCYTAGRLFTTMIPRQTKSYYGLGLELEAAGATLELMSRAGYDIQEVVRYQERLVKMREGAIIALIKTATRNGVERQCIQMELSLIQQQMNEDRILFKCMSVKLPGVSKKLLQAPPTPESGKPSFATFKCDATNKQSKQETPIVVKGPGSPPSGEGGSASSEYDQQNKMKELMEEEKRQLAAAVARANSLEAVEGNKPPLEEDTTRDREAPKKN